MRPRNWIATLIAGSCVALGGVAIQPAAPAAATSGPATATAPQQLVHAYPLGPQRLCCSGQGGVGHTASNGRAASRSTPAATGGSARVTGKPVRHRSSGGVSAVPLIGFVVAAALLLAGVIAVYRPRRARAPVPTRGSLKAAALTSPTRSGLGTDPASGVDEQAYRRLDEIGDPGGAFNLGVALHERGDLVGATSAYVRAEQRGDPDAAFNLGVLFYEAGNLDGAEAAWRRCAARGHVRAAANLIFLSRRRREAEHGGQLDRATPGLTELEELAYGRSATSRVASAAFNFGVMLHQRGDIAGAKAAYERAELRGDPDAAFNLGVLLYETGDLEGADGAWRRNAERGDSRAAENLEFLLRLRRRTSENVGMAGERQDGHR